MYYVTLLKLNNKNVGALSSKNKKAPTFL